MRSLTNDCLQIRGLNLFVYNNESVSNHLRQKKDFFESTTLDYLRDRHKIQKVIIDAGANIGNHSVYFANFLKLTKSFFPTMFLKRFGQNTKPTCTDIIVKRYD